MAVAHAIVTVGTTATALGAAEVVRSFDKKAQSVLVTAGAEDLYLGGAGVTTTDYGYLLAAGASVAMDLGAEDYDTLYGVVGTEDDVAVLYLGV